MQGDKINKYRNPHIAPTKTLMYFPLFHLVGTSPPGRGMDSRKAANCELKKIEKTQDELCKSTSKAGKMWQRIGWPTRLKTRETHKTTAPTQSKKRMFRVLDAMSAELVQAERAPEEPSSSLWNINSTYNFLYILKYIMIYIKNIFQNI